MTTIEASMTTIKASDLSPSKAEETIAKVWLLLVKHDLPSPQLKVTSLFDVWQIEFIFRSEADAARISLDAEFGWLAESNGGGLGYKEYA